MFDERDAEILKIALCGKYQSIYSDIETLCRNCGLYEDDIKAVKGWKYHSRDADPLILMLILDYIHDYERERFDKALYLYNRYR